MYQLGLAILSLLTLILNIIILLNPPDKFDFKTEQVSTVITRSQSDRSNGIDRIEMETFSDDDSNASVPDLYTQSIYRE